MQTVPHERRHFVVHIAGETITFDTSPVKASVILAKGGAEPPSDFILEALSGPHGQAVAQFKPDDEVDLTQPDRKFFRAVPNGGGRS